MMAYAQNTTVTADKSRAEIERTLQRYGADQFMYGWDDARAMIMFRMGGRQIKFLLPMPDKNSSVLPIFYHINICSCVPLANIFKRLNSLKCWK